ncbi:UDP-N-acetylmuramate dehydrogenase [Alysiella filiformis]|uniref:UDP-N-acetylenolpyruvoylglucosamine reductase n=1 Tax=Alysiella filiformis DSM 16848 TaxID=1120981 RepID=A0A286ECW2_9NEIS|nr:UDP-N-acetylmuramate dehydrogenase [Alysiella filiformis]QMT31919.1 UDP-N-acetylmuramate dehydrogenase [Alysiella filiformis]UBQ57174.1 UDP-N-acetylmuramate dehydrogenase [Alysiella filiformis DSM 16848]SOD68762.1 UDP-N-acetylmuramate dehydrogenase [Alysiella filiformis DSM 16848]
MFTLIHQHNLLPHNTFGLNATAAHYIELHDVQDLPQICRLPEFHRHTVLWLGGGSNVLFRQDYSGLVVRMANRGIRCLKRAKGKVHIEAQAGEVWHDFVQHCIQAGWFGLENLSLIPGTVGASPVQNIGAYGVEVKDRIHSVQCFDLEKQEFTELSNADCQFAYRESLFKQSGKGRYVIVAVVFELDETFAPHIQYGDLAAVLQAHCGERVPTATDVAQAVCQIRQSKLPDPKQVGNVGSFFKNPIVSAEQFAQIQAAYPNAPHYPQADGMVKLAAGWLIEQCGLKGKHIGNAAVHDKQALVLVNRGACSAVDLEKLSDYVCDCVAQKFGVALHAEPNWLPER